MNKPYQGRKVPIIRTGTFNYNSTYSIRGFGKTSFISSPMLLFSDKGNPDMPIKYDGFYLDKIITPNIEDLK